MVLVVRQEPPHYTWGRRFINLLTKGIDIMDLLEEIRKFIVINPGITLFGIVTVIQIVPVKVDPWTYILKWVGSVINGGVKAQIMALDKKIDKTRKMAEEDRAEEMRWDIREFAEGCKHGEHHTKEEWRHVIAQLERYEAYVKKYNIVNGVIKEETKYLRRLYETRNTKNDF